MIRREITVRKFFIALVSAALLCSSAAPASAAPRRRSDLKSAQSAGTSGGAQEAGETAETGANTSGISQMPEINGSLVPVPADDAYRTTYEIFVYSFCDSDGDGTGDLAGVEQKLGYINDELGCDALWLMPVFPSPTYHKYDVADYLAIDPAYGDMDSFTSLLDAAHARGMTLILDLPLNHTSTEHPWFQAAAEYLAGLSYGEAPDPSACPYVDYYNFSREPSDGYAPLSVPGDPGTSGGPGGAAGPSWYYEARFWEGMPDLNLDNRSVRAEIKKITRHWLGLGVDGFRLDAVTSFYTGEKNRNIAFLRWLNEVTEAQKPGCYLVGEAWENQSVYAEYYQSGIDSLFDFNFAGAEGVISSVVNRRRPASAYAEALESEEALYASYSDSYVNAPFYTNHDMARSSGYYAWDDGRFAKLAGALNLLMTGNAFIYYGEELGMAGSGKDENKRAPMYWSAAGDAADGEPADSGDAGTGMCAGPPDMDPVRMPYGSCEEQMDDPFSILTYYENAVKIRRSFPALARGKTRVVPELCGGDVCAFFREMSDPDNRQDILVVINLSDSAREADLSQAGDGFTLSAVLTVSGDAVSLEGSALKLPGLGIALLRRG